MKKPLLKKTVSPIIKNPYQFMFCMALTFLCAWFIQSVKYVGQKTGAGMMTFAPLNYATIFIVWVVPMFLISEWFLSTRFSKRYPWIGKFAAKHKGYVLYMEWYLNKYRPKNQWVLYAIGIAHSSLAFGVIAGWITNQMCCAEAFSVEFFYRVLELLVLLLICKGNQKTYFVYLEDLAAWKLLVNEVPEHELAKNTEAAKKKQMLIKAHGNNTEKKPMTYGEKVIFLLAVGITTCALYLTTHVKDKAGSELLIYSFTNFSVLFHEWSSQGRRKAIRKYKLNLRETDISKVSIKKRFIVKSIKIIQPYEESRMYKALAFTVKAVDALLLNYMHTIIGRVRDKGKNYVTITFLFLLGANHAFIMLGYLCGGLSKQVLTGSSYFWCAANYLLFAGTIWIAKKNQTEFLDYLKELGLGPKKKVEIVNDTTPPFDPTDGSKRSRSQTQEISRIRVIWTKLMNFVLAVLPYKRNTVKKLKRKTIRLQMRSETNANENENSSIAIEGKCSEEYASKASGL